MKHKSDAPDHKMLVSAAEAVRDTQNPLSSVEKNKRLNAQRQVLAANRDRKRLGSCLLTAAGVDQNEMERWRQQDAKEMRAFLEREKPAIITQSSVIARQQTQMARQRHAGLSAFGLGTLARPQSLIALDVADQILTDPTSPVTEPDYEVDIRSDPPASMHNFVKSYALANDLLAAQGPQFRTDFLFHWTTDASVALNVVTFVQLNGMYGIYDGFTAFNSTYACISVASSLRYFVPPPPFEGYLARTGSQTQDDINHCVRVGPFDFLGESDVGSYSDEFTLIDNSFFSLPAGYSVIFVVSVIGRLYTGFYGIGGFPSSCSLDLDFRSGDFGINVPAVYLGVFPMG